MTHAKVIKNSTEDTLGYIAVSDQLDAVGIVLNYYSVGIPRNFTMGC